MNLAPRFAALLALLAAFGCFTGSHPIRFIAWGAGEPSDACP